MVRAGSSPGGARPGRAAVWFLPVIVTAGAAGVADTTVPPAALAAVVWCGAVATVLVAGMAVVAARRTQALSALRERCAQQEAELARRLAQQAAQTARLADTLLPQAVARLREGEFVEDVLQELTAEADGVTPAFQAARQAVLRSVLEAVDTAESLRESAQRSLVNIARRVQAIVHRQAQDLREMEDRHGNDPKVFEDLLHVDHGFALVGRLADSIAVIGGARPGRQWSKPVPLFSVLRGAMSRVMDYQRVDLLPAPDVAVEGPAVEPLIHALAELLDNAVRYSPPETRVHMNAVEVQTGIAVEIEDGGLSLSEEGRARAERMLQEAEAGIDLNDLGETPRLGLAVVGRLAHAHGFQVSLRPSAYGGVRAVLIVPQDLITAVTTVGKTPTVAGRTPTPGRRTSAAVGAGSAGRRRVPDRAGSPTGQLNGVRRLRPSEGEDGGSVAGERGSNGLPQRHRRSSPRGDDRPRPIAATPPSAPAEEPQPGLWLADFQSGVSGQAGDAPGGRKSDESSGKGE